MFNRRSRRGNALLIEEFRRIAWTLNHPHNSPIAPVAMFQHRSALYLSQFEESCRIDPSIDSQCAG
jgi:hypothetical protein